MAVILTRIKVAVKKALVEGKIVKAIAGTDGETRCSEPPEEFSFKPLTAIAVGVVFAGPRGVELPSLGIPLQPGAPAFRGQIELRGVVSGGNRAPKKTALQPKSSCGMQLRFGAVEHAVAAISKMHKAAGATHCK